MKPTIAKPTNEDLKAMFDFFNKIEEFVDSEFLYSGLGEYIYTEYTENLDGVWRRCLMALDACLATFTDPDKDHIDIKPSLIDDIKRAK